MAYFRSKTAVAAIVIFPVFSGAAWAAETNYFCEMGDVGTEITADSNNPATITVEVSASETVDQSITGTKQWSRMPWINNNPVYQLDGEFIELRSDFAIFSQKDAPALLCEISNPGTAGGQTHSTGAVGGNEGPTLNLPGLSLGGNMRSGPGTNFGRVAGLTEKTPITLIQNTGVNFDGYDWFEIEANGQRGYQWGGILCASGQSVPGIFEVCENIN